MKKTRLEAFSDGVFAIVITLLILNIELPRVAYHNLFNALTELLPGISVYILSFLLIGMYWVFHHYTFMFMKEVDGVLLWLNIIFLLFISFLPFPTSMMGAYPYQTIPVVIYGLNLLFANLIGFISIIYLNRNRQLASDIFTRATFQSQKRIYIGVNGVYIICIVLAFYTPKVSVIMFGLIAIFLIFRSIVFMGVGQCKIMRSAKET